MLKAVDEVLSRRFNRPDRRVRLLTFLFGCLGGVDELQGQGIVILLVGSAIY